MTETVKNDMTGMGLLKRAEAIASAANVQEQENQFEEELSEDDLFQLAGGAARPVRH